MHSGPIFVLDLARAISVRQYKVVDFLYSSRAGSFSLTTRLACEQTSLFCANGLPESRPSQEIVHNRICYRADTSGK